VESNKPSHLQFGISLLYFSCPYAFILTHFLNHLKAYRFLQILNPIYH
jgi:hypothetical protein